MNEVDAAAVTTTVRGALQIRKTANKTRVRAGGRIDYAIRVGNATGRVRARRVSATASVRPRLRQLVAEGVAQQRALVLEPPDRQRTQPGAVRRLADVVAAFAPAG